MESIDFQLIDWSRAQFALTALYHWLFVPLTLGLTWIIAIMETIYYRTGDPQWKKNDQILDETLRNKLRCRRGYGADPRIRIRNELV